MIGLFVLSGLCGIGWAAYPRWRRRHNERRRRETLNDALIDVADLLVVVLAAGSSVVGALRWLSEQGPQATRGSFVRALERVDSGQPVAVALRSIPMDLGAAYRPLVSSLIVATRDGVPTNLLLLRLGDEARAARRHQRDRVARSLPVRMLFPLVMCSLPAVVVGAVVPLVLVAARRL